MSETWLHNDFNDVELGLVDFNLFRMDRFSNVCVRGGGVLLATKKNLNCKLLNFDPIQGVDQVFVLLSYNNIIILLGCVYFPPNSNIDLYNKHCDLIEHFLVKYSIKNIIIVGDFNLNEFSTSDFTLFRNPISSVLVNFYIDYLNLKQVNNIFNNHKGILDLIFTNSTADSIHSSNYSLIPLIDLYHPPLEFITSFTITNPSIQSIYPEIFNFNSCNFNDILALLSCIDIMDNIYTLDLESAILKFHEIING